MILLIYWMSRQHLASTSAKTNAQSILFAVSTNDDLIKVLQKFTSLAALQLHRLCATPAQFQERSIGIRGLSTNCARGHQITRTQITTCNRVMSNLLEGSPVQMLKVGLADERLIIIGG